jgi:hypothetical protein
MHLLYKATGVSGQMAWVDASWKYALNRIDLDNERYFFHYGATHSGGNATGFDMDGSDHPTGLNNPFTRTIGGLNHSAIYSASTDPTAQYFITQYGNSAPGNAVNYELGATFSAMDNVLDVIYYDTMDSVTDPRTLGWYDDFYSGSKEVHAGTGYASEDTRVFLRNLPPYTKNSHGDWSAMTWGIYKNGFHLSNDAGVYDAYEGQSHVRRFKQVTWGHNNLIVYDTALPDWNTNAQKKGSYRDPGGVNFAHPDNSNHNSSSYSFQSLYTTGATDIGKTMVNSLHVDWCNIQGPEGQLEPEQTDDYYYASADTTAYTHRLQGKAERHWIAIKEPTDDDNLWLSVYTKFLPRDSDIRVLDLVYMPTEPTISGSGSGPYTVDWTDFYGTGRVKMYITSTVDSVVSREGPVVGEIDPVDQYTDAQYASDRAACAGDAGCIAALEVPNTFPIKPATQNWINSRSGAHWQDSQLQWRIEVDPGGNDIRYLMYVYDIDESVPGSQPLVTWDTVRAREVVDGTIPTPQPLPNNPVLQEIGDKSVDEGSALNWTATSTDADGDSVVHTETSDLPSGYTFADQGDNTADFSWTPGSGDAGIYVMTITATDETGRTDFETITVTVNDVTAPEPPVWTQIQNQTAFAGDAISIPVMVTDDDTANNTMTMPTGPTGSSITDYADNTGLFEWTPGSGDADPLGQTHDVTLRADDGTYQVDMNFTITVISVDAYPVLDPILDREVAVGETLTFTVTGSDDNMGYTFYALNVPTGASFNTSTQVFTWTPVVGDVGTHDMSFWIQDSASQETGETITITVNSAASIGSDPVIEAISDVTVDEGDTVDIQVVATDADNDIISVSTNVVDPDATWDEDRLNWNWVTECDDAGVYTFAVTATDSRGGTDTETATITVNESCSQFDPTVIEEKIKIEGRVIGIKVTID